MVAERGYRPTTTVEEMRADLAELAAAERRRAAMPRYSARWYEAVAAEDQVRERIHRWVESRR